MTTVLMSSRHTEDDQAIWRAAIGRGWSVVRARGIQLPDIDDSEIVIYVEALYAAVIAKNVGRKLLDPSENWLAQVPYEFTKRKIKLAQLGEARTLTEPAFVKPPNEKSFVAQVYETGEQLPDEFDDDTSVLIAEPVKWESEFRCFCLDGRVKTISPYLQSGLHAKVNDYQAEAQELEAATSFAETVLEATRTITPNAIVLDVGQIVDKGWAVVEANGAWGSGIYGCDPNAVLDVIRHATANS
ncbi:ATP-grasp domain-containing protein [bacterium]|nr:ATP-grasp domain-containing protein [bacterium]